MALLALPPAREVGPAVTAIDRTLADLMAQMKALEHVDEERRLLEQLTGLAAEVEALQAATVYRFGAARAYDALIRSRIAELREPRVEGYQKIGRASCRESVGPYV